MYAFSDVPALCLAVTGSSKQSHTKRNIALADDDKASHASFNGYKFFRVFHHFFQTHKLVKKRFCDLKMKGVLKYISASTSI